MKHSYIRKSLVLFFGLLPVLAFAQAPLQYQLNQQGGGNCAGSPVELSVSTSVRLTTNDASEITVNTAISGGNVANDGGNAVSQRGVCWSTSPNPTTANFSTSDGSGLGDFSSNLTGLSPNTTYYVRAYAINSAGTFYGNEVSFITGNAANPTAHSCGAENVHNPNLTYGTMTDQEGNVYKTIVIGTQEWMAENLKTSIYRNGDLIPNITDNAEWSGLTTGAWCYYNNDPQFECPYGKLYNWYTVADSRNVCPEGWHVPEEAEWAILTDYLGGTSVASGKIQSTGSQYWYYSNIFATNESGFSGLAGGLLNGGGGGFTSLTGGGGWWSTSEYPEINYAASIFALVPPGADISDSFKNNGWSVRCLRDTDSQQGSINNLDCGSAINNGTLTSGLAANGVSSSIPYTGGNGGTHNGQTVSSTGVTGLTATLQAGTFASGAGSLTYSISGTPITSGTASFALNIGGQTCTLVLTVGAPTPTYTPGSVFCNGAPTEVIEVINPTTGRIWMDRNLGASQAATSSTDAAAYGDLYQWGRGADGHQCRNSATTTTLSSTDQPGHGDFIISTSSQGTDWRIPQNNNLWQGVSGINNPCPSGFRLPTDLELDAERNSWSQDDGLGAFASPLKLTMTAGRDNSAGNLVSENSGRYWSSTANGVNARYLLYSNLFASMSERARASGYAVRCIKD